MRISQSIAAIVIVCSIQFSYADTFMVEKWGTDSGACGDENDPCLTIQAAIDNASNNDNVIVGPGTYTENIVIGKEGLKIRSIAGRYATTILADQASIDAVEITASKVQFGKKGEGFTVSGATDVSGLLVDSDLLTKLKIEGNRFSNNSTGITLNGQNHQVRFNHMEYNFAGLRCFDCENVIVEDNQSVNNTSRGFQFTAPNKLTILRNRASNNSSIAFDLIGESDDTVIKANVGEKSSGTIFVFKDMAGGVIQGNIAANSTGTQGFSFSIDQGRSGEAPPEIKSNLAVDNKLDGFILTDFESVKFNNNIAISNSRNGIHFFDLVSSDNFKNNTTINSGECGIKNNGGDTLNYNNHFFGDPTGPNPPGGNDGICGSSLTTGDFATEPNKFRAKTAAKL